MKPIAYTSVSKKHQFYAKECSGGRLGKQGEWTKTGNLLLFKVNRERDNLAPESYFNKNPAGKAKSGNENIYFPGIIIALNYRFFIGMQKLHRTPGPGTIYRISFFQIFVST